MEYKNTHKINEQSKQKQTHRYSEQIDSYQMGGELGDWVKKVKGIKKYKSPVIKRVMGM